MYNPAAAFNRRMRKTARPVVWEGAGAQSSAPDPIAGGNSILFLHLSEHLRRYERLHHPGGKPGLQESLRLSGSVMVLILFHGGDCAQKIFSDWLWFNVVRMVVRVNGLAIFDQRLHLRQ